MDDLLSSLNPKDNLHELDYSQHLRDAGYDWRNKPTVEELIITMPPVRKPEPIVDGIGPKKWRLQRRRFVHV